jgi:hypothetical protein
MLPEPVTRAAIYHITTELDRRHYDVILFPHGSAARASETLMEFRGLRSYGRGRSVTLPSIPVAS